MKTSKEVPFPPDLEASHGKAWELDHDPKSAVVSSWVVLCPWAHPLWAFHVVSMVSLADIEGLPPAKINEPGMTHEILVMAVNPDWQMKDKKHLPDYLQPMNYVGQIKCDSDAEAEKRAELAVQEIIEGKLNPDSDGIQQWIARFGNNSLKKNY